MRDKTDKCERMTTFCRDIFNRDVKKSEELDHFTAIGACVSGLLGLVLVFLPFQGQIIFNRKDSEIEFTPVAT